MPVEKLVPSANASPATILNTNDYTLINETVAAADASVNDSNINDQTANSAAWALTNVASLIDSVTSATFRVRARISSMTDDGATYQFRLTVNATNYDITFVVTGGSGDTTYADKTIAVGTGFTKAQYDAATVTLTQTSHAKSMASDNYFLEIDAFELEVDYTAVAGSATFKSMDGVADLDIKSVTGLARGSIKNINGVAI